jgi:hypothetical protein
MNVLRKAAVRLVLATAFLSAAAPVAADTDDGIKDLQSQWWQWALAIPTGVNPLADTTGGDCMVGQRGAVWFLAGTFGASSATRSCSVPEGVPLFFPVINQVAFDTPNACGQDSTPLPSKFYRDSIAPFIDGATNVSATLDGKAIRALHRTKSKVFAIAVPEQNLFSDVCSFAGGLPARVYSPAVDDGIYASVDALPAGSHTLTFHAESPDFSFVIDVTYNLTVVPIVTK